MHNSISYMPAKPVDVSVTARSDKVINYFLAGYFLLGLVFASFYGTWLIAVGVGGLSLIAYYSVKIALPNSCLYQYVLGVVLGIFMAQFIYQMHGMFEMHFFAFIGCALLITYQNWKLQIPMLVFVLIHHALFSHLQDIGFSKIYFSQLNYFDLQTFIFHIVLTLMIYFICGLCAFQLQKYRKLSVLQTEQVWLLQEEAKRSIVQQKNAEAMEDRNTILESISDAFFAVDKNWTVTYWNQTAENVLSKTKQEMLDHNLWAVFTISVGSVSYLKYHQAITTNMAIHFEDYFEPLKKWFEISAYPSVNGLSVYFKDITERRHYIAELRESEKRYSGVFHFSPLPMWVVNLESLKFVDVNEATIKHYGYSREEFLQMTLKDIRPASELPNMEQGLSQGRDESAAISHRQMIHQKKNGDLMNMDIQLAPFKYKGFKASIVIATDVTEKLLYIKAIEQQK